MLEHRRKVVKSLVNGMDKTTFAPVLECTVVIHAELMLDTKAGALEDKDLAELVRLLDKYSRISLGNGFLVEDSPE